MNAGRVELDLVAVGKDQVTAMLRHVDAQLKATAGEMGKVSTATDAFSLKSIKGMRENALWALGAVTGLVGVIKALTDSFDLNGQALDHWRQVRRGVNADIEKTRDLIKDVKILLGEKPPDALAVMIERANDAWEKNKKDVTEAENAVNAYNAKLAEGYKLNGQSLKEFAKLEDELAVAKTTYITSLAQQTELEAGILALMTEQAVQARRIRDARAAYAMTPKEAAASQTPRIYREGYGPGIDYAPDEPTEITGGGGGGGGSRPRFDQEAFNKEQQAKFAAWIAAHPMGGTFGDSSGAGGTSSDAEGGPLVQMRTNADALAKSLRDVADATSLISQRMPEMASAIGETGEIATRFAQEQEAIRVALLKHAITQDEARVKSQEALNVAIAGGATAIVANAAKAVGGVRAEAAVRAAFELGMGFATLVNPVESAGHFTAAALLGAVAAGAGKGGGGGARGGGGGRSSGSGQSQGGTTTVVNNFSMGIGDRQTIRQSLRLSERSSRGTGADTRAAV